MLIRGSSSAVTVTMTNTPSSIVCFKNGYSFVCVPVQLGGEEGDQVQQTTLGPLPRAVVHGTIGRHVSRV